MGTAEGVSILQTWHSLHSTTADMGLGFPAVRLGPQIPPLKGQTMELEAPHSLHKTPKQAGAPEVLSVRSRDPSLCS